MLPRSLPTLRLAPLLLLLAGCPDREAAPDAGLPTAGPVDAALPPPAAPSLGLAVESELPDGGTQVIPAGTDERPVVEPTQALVVTTNVPVRNYRLRLFDEADRVLVSDDTAEELPDGTTRYRIQLAEPLRPGHGYSLIMDAQSGTDIQDGSGRMLDEQRLDFQVAGEKQKPAPPQSSPSGKSKRRKR
jgi:hypothetical protein